jgi:hypothetical protein
MSFLPKPASPLPGGYFFQPITPEMIAVLRRADSILIQLIAIAEKYVPKILRARTKIGDKFIRTKMTLETAAKVRETRDETAIHTFILTHDLKRSAELLDQGRDELLRAAWAEFQSLKPDEFDQLARQAGDYLGHWMFAEISKRGAR